MRPLTLLTPALLFAVNPSSAETGSFTIHLLLHSVGEERYTLATSGNGLALETTFEISDRGNKRTTTAAFQASADYTPIALEVKAAQGRTTSALRTTLSPPGAFPVFGPSPFAVELMLMRYWYAHGKPAHVPVMPRAGDAAGSSIAPLEIEMAGRDTIEVNGKAVNLNRFNIGNLMFGREILWTSADGDLAAAMTFAGGLPMEAIRTEYESALPRLYRSGVAQEMANLAALGRQVPPERTGTYAIAGATLISATGSPALADSVVIVRDGRIEEAGDRFQVRVPRGVPVLEAKGQTLLPGLWEMHTHFSGVEFGPALLAAGITTARDCGGEFEYLIAQRNAIRNKSALSPHLLLAGLVDSGGPKAFGHITAETPDAGRAVVHRYHEAGFQQIKLYTFLKPEVVKAICVEAHLLGMTVTGHVPQAMNAFQGVEAGMDQINHLNYVSAMMRNADSARGAPVDINSEVAKNAIQFFKDHHTVVDPTAGWGEMASHSKDVDVESFEPGIKSAPLVLEAKFRGLGSDATAEQMQTRTAQSLAVVGALHRAGVTIVPGSDTGLVGYGLIRELELYVKAGMSTMEAIQCATIVSARAMHLDQEYGTIERGKRADLILVDGNPLDQISQLRSVSRVIIGSRMFSAAKLWHSVGFSQKMR